MKRLNSLASFDSLMHDVNHMYPSSDLSYWALSYCSSIPENFAIT
jgi:hypothetical protein